MANERGYDAVVIGAGVIGCSVALELARSGRSVVVVDPRSGPGYGSTSASSAIVRYHYDHVPETALAWEAGHRWMEWERYLGCVDPTGMARFIRSGALVLEGPAYDLPRLVDVMRAVGVDVDWVSSDDIRALFPGVDPQRYGPPARLEDERFWGEAHGELRGFHVANCGHVNDPQLAAHNLAYAAEVNGATFRYGSPVVAVTSHQARVTGVELADGSVIGAPIVVNVAGPWSSQINRLADVLDDFTMTTKPVEQEVVAVPAPSGFRLDDGGTCLTDPDFGTYFRVHSGNMILVGSLEAECDPLVILDSPDDAVEGIRQETWELQSLRLARRIPGVVVPSKPAGVVGVYDVTEDWIPVYDRTSLDGYYVTIGTSGHGFKQAPFVGELMTALIDAVEGGHDHDAEPVVVTGSWTGVEVDLGHFSRRRVVVPQLGMG